MRLQVSMFILFISLTNGDKQYEFLQPEHPRKSASAESMSMSVEVTRGLSLALGVHEQRTNSRVNACYTDGGLSFSHAPCPSWLIAGPAQRRSS
ncbi:hypothetical protein J6590_003789 [Homalodisca vitripennis]|nr:hypothetical protein J6590_003789 [Homalodisca vitripennis]